MVVHNIVDLSPLYYRHWFRLRNGKAKVLTACVNGEETDVSVIYPVLRDIESFRKKLESKGNTVVTSVCFDMPSKRKEMDSNYKEGRTKLEEKDFENIQLIEKILKNTGVNTFRVDGFEADDIIKYLVDNAAQVFGFNIIYTGDKDMLVNIRNGVGVRRYKTTKGWQSVDINNYEEYISNEFGCTIPYNAVGLYLITVGDSADKISGIKGFGKRAFDKLVEQLEQDGFKDWSSLGDYDELERVLDRVEKFVGKEKCEQARESLRLVRNLEISENELGDMGSLEAFSISTRELREAEYTKYQMASLID